MEPLGPPPITQTCHEAWEFARIHDQRLTYHAAKIPALSPGSIAPLPPACTWFNPGVDVICINEPWRNMAYDLREPCRLGALILLAALAETGRRAPVAQHGLLHNPRFLPPRRR
ncbi:hypothetical protein F5Y06DRAFT_24271 [Hypoxylon sp. FL0890]|nr:hypothetical protein F5Y06DRAFT_24271 [Hypoxylon sp. FL0890]